MVQWLIDKGGVSRYETEGQGLFLYQHLRAKNGKIAHLQQHLELLENTSQKLFGQSINLTEKIVLKECEELLSRGGYSSTAVHILELRIWQGGEHQIRVVETSLYKEFTLRVMRPKAMVAQGCNYPFNLPTSAALAMVDFMRLSALEKQCQVALCVDQNSVVNSVDGATPIVVHGTTITAGNLSSSLYTDLVVDALKNLPNHTLVIAPISLAQIECADELFYADARGITAVGSLDSTHFSDSVAYAISKKMIF